MTREPKCKLCGGAHFAADCPQREELGPGMVAAFFAERTELDDLRDCLVWKNGVNTAGAPMTSLERKNGVQVKTWAWRILRGPIPAGRYLVPVVCGNARCCNMDHHKLLTGRQRNQWLARTGKLSTPARRRSSALNARARSPLTREIVDAMKAEYQAGHTQVEIGRKYGVHHSTVHNVCRGKSWGTLAPGASVFALGAA